eukprot:82302-Chlamydomonas_euryale.AAC.1
MPEKGEMGRPNPGEVFVGSLTAVAWRNAIHALHLRFGGGRGRRVRMGVGVDAGVGILPNLCSPGFGEGVGKADGMGLEGNGSDRTAATKGRRQKGGDRGAVTKGQRPKADDRRAGTEGQRPKGSDRRQ